MIARLVALALVTAAPAPTLDGVPGVPDRADLARHFACPAGTEQVGAVPPEGLESWCERPDAPPRGRKQGPSFTWYDDGQLARATTFENGLQEGRFLEWHRNGRLARIGSFHAGEREGTWRIYFESGRPEEECGYLGGQRHGAFATWWPNGAPRVRGRYCHDVQCGAWTSWDEEGRELGTIRYEEVRATP